MMVVKFQFVEIVLTYIAYTLALINVKFAHSNVNRVTLINNGAR